MRLRLIIISYSFLKVIEMKSSLFIVGVALQLATGNLLFAQDEWIKSRYNKPG